MKRIFAFILAATALVAFSLPVMAAGPKKLTMADNFLPTDAVFKTMQDIAAAYNKANPGVVVEVVNLPDYENTMRTKMAANDLPDLWTTHGWSVARYSEYLQPLNDQAWASKLSPTIKPVITDKDGKFFVLPMDMDVAGIAFNREVLDKAGVDPFKIKTWDDFKAACEKVKKIGKTAVQIGGKPSQEDDWTVGNFYDWTAPSFLITNEKANSRAALKDGSFDWTKWGPVAKLLVDFRDAGYLNPDYTQGTWQDVGKKLGTGEAAFGFFGNYVITEAKKYAPNGKFGFIPVPSVSKDDTPSLITGERMAIGVWKDTPNKAEALKFLAYCAKPENVSKIATVTVNPTGLVGAGYKSDAGDLTPYFDKIAGVRGFPYFDRAYLPSGMWNSMCKTGTGLLSNSMTLDQAIARMKGDYTNLINQ
jgi:raffinose/stachyose/melibiose transport system substrate-binding protein